MLVPLSWLREFTPYDGNAEALGDRLTMLGLELEEIVNPFANIAGIITGFVAQCLPHPDSDHLHCCKVDIGGEELLDIVCGAPNVAEGQKVAVAPVGCSLPDGTIIKKAKLRGQTSVGMICSERELGLSEDHSGILVLPEATVVGEKLTDALNMDCEVLDLSITPNRADCLSILGVARETAMAFHLPFNVPEIPLILDNKEIALPVAIDNPELCWLYSGRVLTDIKVEKSPMRMRYRLLAVGVRPISNIVDVTNYVLFECGQPLHSFDMDKIAGNRIEVREAAEGQKFVTLDGKERILHASDLCIWDAEKPIGLAGVMGGLNTEITAASNNVFLESAVFNPRSIRKTSRRLGLTSEASYRFERGVDQNRAIWALDRASALIASLGAGLPARGFSCLEPKPFTPAKIVFAPDRTDALLGARIPVDFQKKTLENIGCAVEENEARLWTVIQPSWRPDLEREADLIEEVGRVYGLDAIEPTLPKQELNLNDLEAYQSNFGFIAHIKHWGAGIGLNEAVNYSFVGQEDLDFLNLEKEDRIAILNPLSEEQNVLRTCLAPGLLQALGNNLAFGAQSVRLFETATAFHASARETTGATETPMLGILLYGLRHEPGWPHAECELDYVDMKGILDNLLHYLGISGAKYELVENHPYLLPAVALNAQNRHLGVIGRVQTKIAQKYNAQKPIWLCELDLQVLNDLHGQYEAKFQIMPIYPPVRRDITVMAPREIRVENILEKIFLMKMPLLEGAVLVDCYEPEGRNERNLTFRLTFRHAGRTLKDAEVDREREKVAEFLQKNLNVRI